MKVIKRYPDIRFKGFSQDWEQRKSRDISPLRGGFAFKSAEFQSKGIPIVRISNILTSGDVGDDFIFYNEQENDEKYTLTDRSIVLAMSGATTGKVAVLSSKNTGKVYQNQRVGYFMPVEGVSYEFISTLMRSQIFLDQLSSVLVSGAQPNVSSKEIDAFNFYIPETLNEQSQIGLFFNKLDNTITLHQRKYFAVFGV